MAHARVLLTRARTQLAGLTGFLDAVERPIAKHLTPAERAEVKAHVQAHFEARGLDYATVCAGVARRSAQARERRIAAEREYYQEQELRRRGQL